MIATTSVGQTNCGKFDFIVGEVGSGATNPFTNAAVPSSALGDYIVGIDLKVETSDERIRQLVSVTTANFRGGQATLNYGITPNASKGQLVQLRAPSGCAMSGLRVWGSDITGQIAMHWTNILTGAMGTTSSVGYYPAKNAGRYQDIRSPGNAFVVRIGGRFNRDGSGSSGDRLCGITIFSRQFDAELQVIRTDTGKVNSCMGLSTAATSYQPQSTTCEQYMSGYCNQNPTSPTCSCIKSKLAGSSYNPICTDVACISGGYKPQGMITSRGASCPSITTCTQVFDMRENYGIIDFREAQFAQNCIAERTAPPATKTQTTVTGGGNDPVVNAPAPPVTYAPYTNNTAPPPPPEPEGLSTMMIIAIIFIVVVVLAIIAYIVLSSGDDDDNDADDNDADDNDADDNDANDNYDDDDDDDE